MNILNKPLAIAVAALLGVGAASQASATCFQLGKVARSYTTNAEVAYYYIAPLTSALTEWVTWYEVPVADPRIKESLDAALAGGHTVGVYGNAGVCPVAGTFRYGGLTTLVYVYPRN